MVSRTAVVSVLDDVALTGIVMLAINKVLTCLSCLKHCSAVMQEAVAVVMQSIWPQQAAQGVRCNCIVVLHSRMLWCQLNDNTLNVKRGYRCASLLAATSSRPSRVLA